MKGLLEPCGPAELEQLIEAALKFERTTHRRSGIVDEVGEQTVATLLGAKLRPDQNGKGWDLQHPSLGRIQVKTRMERLDGKQRRGFAFKPEGFNHLVLLYLNLDYTVRFGRILTAAEASAIKAIYQGNVQIKAALNYGEPL